MPLDTTRSQVAHLLRRAGFGASEAELDQYAALGFSGALERLLNPEQVDDAAADAIALPMAMDPTSREARGQLEPSKFWWLKRMLATQRPLREKMVLFWHNHFATANSKVGNAVLMVQQNQLFREHALGNFETLLQKVTRDPAMLIWLDNRQNQRRSPNENYAREVMELFTVGIGNYTEDDIKEAARAFTGHTLSELKYVFNPRQHDTGDKTFMGQTGNFDADDILGILVRHPATARFLTTKLFSFFVYENPDPSTIDRLANTFTTSNFDIRAVLRDIFSGPEFLSAQAYHAQIKAPVDLVVGSLKELNVSNVGENATQVLRRMGQDLFNPPDVSGWTGGATWINSTTLFERFNWANQLASARNDARPYFTDIAGQVRGHGLESADSLVDYYLGLLVDGDATPEARQALIDFLNRSDTFSLAERNAIDMKVRGMVHLAMSVPAYQLA
jgi:uncharacterized protein (DUF1800 family)